MTPRQLEALEFIDRFSTQHGFSPSLDEIAAGLGLKAKSAAHRIVAGLIDRGYLRREGTRRLLDRSLVVVKVGGSRFDGVSSAELRAELARRGEVVA